MKKLFSLLSGVLLVSIFLLSSSSSANASYYMGYCGSYIDEDGNRVDVYETKNYTYWLIVHTEEGDRWVYYTPYGGGTPNPDDASGGGGDDVVGDIIQAIESGDLTIVAKGVPISSEMFGFGGIGDSPRDLIWIPSEDGVGQIVTTVDVGNDKLKEYLNWLEVTLAGMPSSCGGVIDEAGEFNPDWDANGPSGNGGTGTGSGDDGDGETDRDGSESGFTQGDGDYDTVIHPQANPAP